MKTFEQQIQLYKQLPKEELIKHLRNKDLELDHLKAFKEHSAFTPVNFIQNFIRQEFWDKIRIAQGFAEDKLLLQSEHEAQQNKIKAMIDSQEHRFNVLLGTKESTIRAKQRYEKAHLEASRLKTELREAQFEYEDNHAKAHYYAREQVILDEKKEFYEKNFLDLERSFKEAIIDYQKERRKLTERINHLTVNANLKERRKHKGLLRIVSEYRSTQIFYSSNSEYNLDRIVLRFDTVASDPKKYLEILDLVKNFYVMVQNEKDFLEKKSAENLSKKEKIELKKCQQLLGTLGSKKMYRNYFRGLRSPDEHIFDACIDFIVTLGFKYLEENISYFEDDRVVSRICRYLYNEDLSYQRRKTMMQMVLFLSNTSQKFVETFVLFGGIQVLLSEICTEIDPIFINSPYYGIILEILKISINEDQVLLDFHNPEILKLFIKLLDECDNQSTLFNILMIIDHLSKDRIIRHKLFDLKLFGALVGFYRESWDQRNIKLLFYVFVLFGKFTKHQSFKNQLISHLELDNDFTALFEPFREDNKELSTREVQISALEIISNLVLNIPLEERKSASLTPQSDLRDLMVKSTFLKSLIKNAFLSTEPDVREYALECLISVYDLILLKRMEIDDFVIGLEKTFDLEPKKIKKLLLLLIAWGLLFQVFTPAVISSDLLNSIIETGASCIEKGSPECFKMSLMVVFLLIEDQSWAKVILAMQYYEKYVTTRVSNHTSSKREWLRGLCLLTMFPSFLEVLKSNTNLLEFIWFEIKERCKDMNEDVIMVIKATLEFEALAKFYDNEKFLTDLVRGFVRSYQEYSSDRMVMVALEIFYFFCGTDFGCLIYARNKRFFGLLVSLFNKGDTDLNQLSVRIMREIISTVSAVDLFKVVDMEFFAGFEVVMKHQKELQVEAFVSDIVKTMEDKDLVEDGKLEKGQYSEQDLEEDIETVFDRRTMLLENEIGLEIEAVLRKFQMP